jgi:hypothetical protein
MGAMTAHKATAAQAEVVTAKAVVAISESNRKGTEEYSYSFDANEFCTLLMQCEAQSIRWYFSAACNGLTHRSSFPAGVYKSAKQLVDAIEAQALKARSSITKIDQEKGADLFKSVEMAGWQAEFPDMYGCEFTLENCIQVEYKARLERDEAKRVAEKAAAERQAAELAAKLQALRAAKAAKEGK